MIQKAHEPYRVPPLVLLNCASVPTTCLVILFHPWLLSANFFFLLKVYLATNVMPLREVTAVTPQTAVL